MQVPCFEPDFFFSPKSNLDKINSGEQWQKRFARLYSVKIYLMNFFVIYSFTAGNGQRKTNAIITKKISAAQMAPAIVCRDSD